MSYYDGERDVQRRKDEARALAERYVRENQPDQSRRPSRMARLGTSLASLFRRLRRTEQPVSPGASIAPGTTQDYSKVRP
jgi:hypothetical protein